MSPATPGTLPLAPTGAAAPRPFLVTAPRTLSQCIGEVERIADMVETLDSDADRSDEQTADLQAALLSALGGTRQKVDATAAALALFEQFEAGAQKEIDRLKARAEYYGRQRERLENYVLAILEANDLPRLEGETSALIRRKNPASVVILDDRVIPDEFKLAPPPPVARPDKAAIKQAIKNGFQVSGARLDDDRYRLVRS